MNKRVTNSLSTSGNLARNFQLCFMMFMQYMLVAVWWVPLAAYLSKTLQLEVYQVSLILCAMAIGSMGSSFIGAIADRFFPAEKILAVLNLLTGIFLLLAAQQQSFPYLMACIVLAMLCYMPSWSLTSTIAMSHTPSEQFPRIRIFGSIGWVASGIFSLVGMHYLGIERFDETAYPMYCGAGISLLAAISNLFLPSTPPTVSSDQKISVKDVIGAGAFSLLKDRNYAIFMGISFLSIIPFTLYHVYGSMILADEDVQNITVTMNFGQLAEMCFLFLTTWILVKYGIKKTLIFGLGALLVRYAAFYFGDETGQQWLYMVGIVVHGLIFGLFYVGGQVYTNEKATDDLRAQAQGFLSFLVWGVGFLIGTLLNGVLINTFRDGDKCDWGIIFLISSIYTVVLILLFIIFFNPEKDKPKE